MRRRLLPFRTRSGCPVGRSSSHRPDTVRPLHGSIPWYFFAEWDGDDRSYEVPNRTGHLGWTRSSTITSPVRRLREFRERQGTFGPETVETSELRWLGRHRRCPRKYVDRTPSCDRSSTDFQSLLPVAELALNSSLVDVHWWQPYTWSSLSPNTRANRAVTNPPQRRHRVWLWPWVGSSAVSIAFLSTQFPLVIGDLPRDQSARFLTSISSQIPSPSSVIP